MHEVESGNLKICFLIGKVFLSDFSLFFRSILNDIIIHLMKVRVSQVLQYPHEIVLFVLASLLIYIILCQVSCQVKKKKNMIETHHPTKKVVIYEI